MPRGTTLLDSASWAGIAVDSTCGARGTCHKCRVRVVDGTVTPSVTDQRAFTRDELRDGWRLACRSSVRHDLTLDVPAPPGTPKAALFGRGRHVVVSPSLQLRSVMLTPPTLEDQVDDLDRLARALPDIELQAPPAVLRQLPFAVHAGEATAVVVGNRLIAVEPIGTRGYGMAIDIGTTTIVAALVDIAGGTVVAVAAEANAQERFGADVISRISAAAGRLGELRDCAVATLRSLVERVCADANVDPSAVYHAVVAGNATMLHLLLGVDPTGLAVSPFAPAFREGIDVSARELGLPIHPEARIQTLPLFGAYVGADLAAGILATGLGRDDRTSLLIDIGTNGEVVLAANGRIVATAAPAGPAFEGGEISCGMRAVPGAIETVRIGRTVEIEVIGGCEPLGLCGSGLADAAAGLLAAGILDRSGRLHGGVFTLAEGIELTQSDVRALQYAKGAIAAGTQILLQELDVAPSELDDVLLAGSFGTYIDPGSARAIGLIPDVPLDRVASVGNTSLEGAKMALVSFRELELALHLPARVEYVELSARPDFADTFVSTLAFPEEEAA